MTVHSELVHGGARVPGRSAHDNFIPIAHAKIRAPPISPGKSLAASAS